MSSSGGDYIPVDGVGDSLHLTVPPSNPSDPGTAREVCIVRRTVPAVGTEAGELSVSECQRASSQVGEVLIKPDASVLVQHGGRSIGQALAFTEELVRQGQVSNVHSVFGQQSRV